MADNFNQLVGSGIEIYGSREKIRDQLSSYAKEYLNLDTVDFYKTSVMGYLIDTLSILSANHNFYDSVIYREFFMVEAQMSESVYNLVRWIGYNVPKATPSTVNVMFTIPLSFDYSEVSFAIPSNFKVYAGSVPFTIDVRSSNYGKDPAARMKFDKTTTDINGNVISTVSEAAYGKIINSNAISVVDSNGFQRPIAISEDGKAASFTLSFTQHERIVQQFLIPSEVQPYQFFSKVLKFSGMVSSFRVWVSEASAGEKITLDYSKADNFYIGTDTNGSKKGPIGNAVYSNGTDVEWSLWTEAESGIYTMSPNSEEYVFAAGTNQGELFFGNGVLGKQPPANSAVTVEMYITKGEDGVIIPYTISKGDKLYYTNANIETNTATNPVFRIISYSVTNSTQSFGGTNTPTLPEIKRNAIVNLRSKERLVSDVDYNDINTILGSSFPVTEAFPILKRSDLKVNEIMTFVRLLYHDKLNQPQIVPTRNVKFPIYDPEFVEDSYTINRTTPITVGEEVYQTLFNMTIDKGRMMAYYDYVIQNATGTPAIIYSEGQYNFYNSYIYIPIRSVDFNVALSNETGSSSSSINTSSYALSIKVNVNHVPNSQDASDYQFYNPDDADGAFRCTMITKWDTNAEYEQSTVTVDHDTQYGLSGKFSDFTFEIPNYLDIPYGVQRFEFQIDGYGLLRNNEGQFIDEDGLVITETDEDGNVVGVEGWIPYSKHYVDITIRQDLSDVMYSTVTKTNTWDGIVHSDSIRYDIHNVPVIYSNYLNDGTGNGVLEYEADQNIYPNFEFVVLQSLIGNLNISSSRMLTDSINVKFPDTRGTLNNLKYNPVDYTVNSRFKTPFKFQVPDDITFVNDGLTDPITPPETGTVRYIVNGTIPGYENLDVSTHINYIAELYRNSGEGGADVWYLTKPERGMYVLVEDELDDNEDSTILAFDGNKWIDVQSFSIPLKVKVKVEIDKYSTTSKGRLIELVKSTIVDGLSPYMGIQKEIDRSEIVTMVRSLSQVNYCEVSEPAIDIRFKYDIRTDLSQEQLIDYTPQYIGITTDDIEVEII